MLVDECLYKHVLTRRLDSAVLHIIWPTIWAMKWRHRRTTCNLFANNKLLKRLGMKAIQFYKCLTHYSENIHVPATLDFDNMCPCVVILRCRPLFRKIHQIRLSLIGWNSRAEKLIHYTNMTTLSHVYGSFPRIIVMELNGTTDV